eukprot:6492685-Amphidinium_carterae.3
MEMTPNCCPKLVNCDLSVARGFSVLQVFHETEQPLVQARTCLVTDSCALLSIHGASNYQGDMMFNPTNPCLSSVQSMADIHKAKEFQKLWATKSLLRLVKQGAMAAAAVQLLCERLRELMLRLSGQEESLLLQVAYQEAQLATEGILALCGCCPEECEVISAVDKFMQSKDSTTSSLKLTFTQTPYWREREKRVRSQSIAITEMRPQVDQARAVLAQDNISVTELMGIAGRLSLWSQTLQKGGLGESVLT